MAPRCVARQLARPNGFLGRLIGKLMNRHNARMNAFAVRRLELAPSDRVLEIGFGGGVALRALLEGAAFVAGVDRSRDAVAWARQRFAAEVDAGRMDLREGQAESLPFADASFAKACTVNTIYFWPSLEASFAEIRRVLAPGGRLAVGFLPKERMARLNMPADIFTLRAPEEVIGALETVRFDPVRVERPDATTPWNVVVADC
jgi:arsenite methyltransferase